MQIFSIGRLAVPNYLFILDPHPFKRLHVRWTSWLSSETQHPNKNVNSASSQAQTRSGNFCLPPELEPSLGVLLRFTQSRQLGRILVLRKLILRCLANNCLKQIELFVCPNRVKVIRKLIYKPETEPRLGPEVLSSFSHS